MFRDQNVIKLLLYRLKRKADPNRIDNVWDGVVLWELLNRKVEIDGQVQDYTYGELDIDVFLVFTCDGISIHKGIGAWQSQTEYACFPLELLILNLPLEVQMQD